MSIVRGFFLRLAVKRYAAALGPELLKGCGSSKFYTPGQIRAAASRRRLPARHLKIGYAAFLDLDGFLSVVSDGSLREYETFRALFQRYLPSHVPDTFAPATIDASGGPGWPGSSHDS